MAIVLLPGLLAAQAGGRSRFEVTAGTVEEALRTLPIADLLFDERGALRPLVNVYVEGEDVRGRGGLGSEIGESETVRIIAAIAGG